MKKLLSLVFIILFICVGCSDNEVPDDLDKDDYYSDTDASSRTVDSDSDGYTPSEGDCDDSDATIYPRAVRTDDFDLKDNDCDGEVDEDFVKDLAPLSKYAIITSPILGSNFILADCLSLTSSTTVSEWDFFKDHCEKNFDKEHLENNSCIVMDELFPNQGKISLTQVDDRLKALKVYAWSDHNPFGHIDHAYVVETDTEAINALTGLGYKLHETTPTLGYILPYEESCPESTVPLKRLGVIFKNDDYLIWDYAISIDTDEIDFMLSLGTSLGDARFNYFHFSKLVTEMEKAGLLNGLTISDNVGCVWE